MTSINIHTVNNRETSASLAIATSAPESYEDHQRLHLPYRLHRALTYSEDIVEDVVNGTVLILEVM